MSEHFDWQGYRFEVVDMDRNRIDRLLVTRMPNSDIKSGNDLQA
jgi:putative hemolysin